MEEVNFSDFYHCENPKGRQALTDRPNILFFFTDDQRFDTIAALGNPQILTPNLDALVKRGTAFTRAHIPGGTSAAVCMPSRAMLHTGRTLFHIENVGQEIPQSHRTIGECFRSAGYTTFGTGKWHNGKEAFARSFNAGAEIFFGGMNDHWNVPAYNFNPDGTYETKLPMNRDHGRSKEVTYRDGDHVHAGKHSTELFTDASIDFLESRTGDNPFFMYVSLMAPHDPRNMPQKFQDMYNPEDIKLPENFQPEHLIDTGALRIRDEMLAEFPRDPKEIKEHLADYYAMITHLDHEFGRLVATLEARGELDNTIIVIAGDNGLAVGQHGLMGKQSLYDHSVRVPLVFAGPGIPAGQQSDALVYLLDIFPTLCGLTDTPVPESVEGRNLVPCLHAPEDSEPLYLAYCDTIRGLTTGRHKLIEYACGSTQLFDLEADPLEMHNLADSSPLLPELRQRLRALSCDWDDETHRHGKAFWEKRPDLP